MDSVIMTTPGNSMRLRSRLRSAANTICARSSRNRSHHNHNRNNSNLVNTRNLVNRHQHQPVNRHGNLNLRSCDNANEPKHTTAVTRPASTTTITREVYNAWCGRLGDVTRIPSDSVQALFNDMQLYPSKNQVVEMLQCARQCGRRNSSHFLTFGEFCVFAGELRRGGSRNNRPPQQHPQRAPSSQCEVFLGGSCNPTTWRADLAIPTLSQHNITYYNPQVSTWSPELMAAEHQAKEAAAVLLFVVDSQTRCVAGMLEVAHLVAQRRTLVLVLHPFSRAQSIMGETLTQQEFSDLSEGQATLLALVRSQGVQVHQNLSTALQCTVNLLRGPDTKPERNLSDKLMKLREVFDSVDNNHTGELSLTEVSYAYYQLTGSSLRISDLQAIMNLSGTGDVSISFEQFCGIVAEFTTADGCPVEHGAHRFTNVTYWKLAMLRTQQLLRIYVVRPIVQIIDWVQQPLVRQSSTNNNTNGFHAHYDMYLGGSLSTWRQNIAIPLLKRYGITYYNPTLHEQDVQVLSRTHIVLFVITAETRSITSLILAAHYIALRRNVVLCVQQLPADQPCRIGDDVLTKQAVKDYNRARAYLTDLAKHENVPTFTEVQQAVECAVTLHNHR